MKKMVIAVLFGAVSCFVSSCFLGCAAMKEQMLADRTGAHIKKGLVYSSKNEYSKALEETMQAYHLLDPLYRHRDYYHVDYGWSLNNIGYYSIKLGKLEDAKEYLTKGLEIEEKHPDQRLRAHLFGNLSYLYSNKGRYSKAAEYSKKSKEIRKELYENNPTKRTASKYAWSLKHLGYYCAETGNLDQAENALLNGLNIESKFNDLKLRMKLLASLAYLYFDSKKAVEYYRRQLEGKIKHGDRIYKDPKQKEESILETYTDLAFAMLAIGDYVGAIKLFSSALKKALLLQDRKNIIKSYGGLASAYANLGNRREFIESIHSVGKVVGISMDQNVDQELIRQKVEDFIRSMRESRIVEDYELIQWLHRASEHAILVDKKYAETILHGLFYTFPYDQSRSMRKAKTLYASLLLDVNRISKAEMIIADLKDSLLMGRLYFLKGDYGESIRNYRKAIDDKLNQQVNYKYAAYVGLARTYEAIFDYENAVKHYLSAIELLDHIRMSLNDSQKRLFYNVTSFGFSRMAPYEGLARILFRQGKYKSSFRYVEYTKARLFAESIWKRQEDYRFGLPDDLSHAEDELHRQLMVLTKLRQKAFSDSRVEDLQEIDHRLEIKKAELLGLIDRLRKEFPEYASLRYPQPLRPDEIHLTQNEYLVEYEVTDSETLCFLIHQGEIIKTHTAGIARDKLRSLVRRYRSYFEVRTLTDLGLYDATVGHELFSLLLKDILMDVPEESRVIIIPDDVLAILPFEALVVHLPQMDRVTPGKFGSYHPGIRYVMDDYMIRYHHSATSLTMVRKLKGDEKPSKRVLVVADPVFDVADGRMESTPTLASSSDSATISLMRTVEESANYRFPRLAMTGNLASRLKEIFPERIDVMTGLEATESNLKRRDLADYNYLVFATHGILDSQVPGIREPALVMTQLNDPEQDGFLTLNEVMDFKLDTSCCALTACQTGLGKNIRGEGVMALGRAFQYAGAKSVLVSLWSVAEDPTVNLVWKFSYYLKQGKDRSAALRLSRKDIRSDGYEHPFYWASFILIGE